MATRGDAAVVKAAALVQGIALVTFPAASTVFTDPSEYDLSTTAYGAMFVPQAIAAISGSFLGARWASHTSTRRVYLCGLAANLVSMSLLVLSAIVHDEHELAYTILLVATASLGLGFGFTVPALNTFTAAFYPSKVDGSVLVLNALLGLGTALAPVFVAIFVGLGFWWGLPVGVAAALAVILVVSTRLPLHVAPAAAASTERHALPSRFWIFAAFAVGYGICETMNGNWATLDMKALGASTTMASLALTAFWGSVTIGRVLFAAIQQWLPTRRTYVLLPIVLAGAFVAISLLPDDEPALGILAFAVAGLGCSALLPLTISFGQGELVTMSASFAGAAIAFYQIGYGITAFGVGPLEDSGVELSTLYGFAALVAAALVVLALTVVRGVSASSASASSRR
jgi:MFS family permease